MTMDQPNRAPVSGLKARCDAKVRSYGMSERTLELLREASNAHMESWRLDPKPREGLPLPAGNPAPGSRPTPA